MCIQSCSLSDRYIPKQYLFRACEAKKILSTTDATPKQMAALIAVAELGQILFFVLQALLYTLAFAGIIPPQLAGTVSLVLMPLEAMCSYQTFVHYKSFSRFLLTAAAVLTLSLTALFALGSFVTDSAITLCAGGVALHLFRNISEHIDANKAYKNPDYRAQILQENVEENGASV